MRLDLNCFCRAHTGRVPTFSDEEFGHHFHFSCRAYEHVRAALLVWRDPYFVEIFDAAGVRVLRQTRR
jgi:hypothetical protein